MLHTDRIGKLAEILRTDGLEAIFAGPSADMEYLADLKLFDDERPKGLMISKDGKCFALVPMLYGEEMRNALGESVSHKIWADHEGFHEAFRGGCRELGIGAGKIAINDGVRAVDLIEMKKAVGADYVNGAETLSPLRSRKDETELENMRRAGAIADAVMEDISKFLKPGMKERDVRDRLLELFAEQDEEGLSFSPIVASGPGGSMPHYQGSGREIRGGDFVVIDMGCRYRGYCSDMTRTFCIGEPTAEMKKVYGIVLEAQKAGEAAVRAGATGQDVDRAARRVIADAGYGDCFLNRLGHGVGIAIHENPYIIEGNDAPLVPGNVFSVEPGIYLPGKFGVRIENLVAVRADGTAEPLNKFTRDMIVIK
ncbi:MAG: aminopeptidase P family protein [Synergistaceae bacterium]|jgi:Xaa-Pro aminopeptidase|nr:aminopeptidase P family protein [Synergistaceae bacterium]